MQVLNLLNAIIIEVKKNNKNLYLFLDAGFPHSFSNDINSINNTDLSIDINFVLDLQNHPIDLSGLSKIFGVKLSGILGIDFFHKFNNIMIDINGNNIDFNVDTFDYDFEIDLKSNSPFIIELSIENGNNNKECLVDTGAFQCMKFSNNFINTYKSSNGWKFPSAMGLMEINYYSNVPIYLNNCNRGNYIFGIPTNLPQMPFDYVLGLNFLSDYICLFDIENGKIKFKKSNTPNILNTQPCYSLKFQIEIINKEIIVSNKLYGCNFDINIGDKIILPDLNMNNLEAVNEIYNRLLFLNDNKEVELICNNKLVKLKPCVLFE